MLNQNYSFTAIRNHQSSFLTIFFIAAARLAPQQIFAQADNSPVVKINEAAAQADITVERLRGNISVLTGSGGNIVAFTGSDGKLPVDAGIAVSRPKIQTALDGISNAPLKYVIIDPAFFTRLVYAGL